MPRSYNTRAVAFTVGVPVKWLDNVLSHHEIPGVTGGRQGLERRITDAGLLAVELVRIMTQELDIPIARAVELTLAAIATPADRPEVRTDSGLVLTVPVRDVTRRLRERLTETLESVAPVPRGRPVRDA